MIRGYLSFSVCYICNKPFQGDIFFKEQVISAVSRNAFINIQSKSIYNLPTEHFNLNAGLITYVRNIPVQCRTSGTSGFREPRDVEIRRNDVMWDSQICRCETHRNIFGMFNGKFYKFKRLGICCIINIWKLDQIKWIFT